MTNNPKTTKGSNTVSIDTVLAFTKDIELYVESLRKEVHSNKEEMNPLAIAFNELQTEQEIHKGRNLDDILKDYIKISTEELSVQGVHRGRGRSISRHTLEKVLEEKMQEICF